MQINIASVPAKSSGSFIIGFGLQDEWMKQFVTTNFRTALFDSYIPQNPNIAYVETDSFERIVAAVDHFKDGYRIFPLVDLPRLSAMYMASSSVW